MTTAQRAVTNATTSLRRIIIVIIVVAIVPSAIGASIIIVISAAAIVAITSILIVAATIVPTIIEVEPHVCISELPWSLSHGVKLGNDMKTDSDKVAQCEFSQMAVDIWATLYLPNYELSLGKAISHQSSLYL